MSCALDFSVKKVKYLSCMLALLMVLSGCSWTPERVSKWSDFDLCYQQWSEPTLVFSDGNRIRVVQEELARRRVDCKVYEKAMSRRYQQYLDDLNYAIDVGRGFKRGQ